MRNAPVAGVAFSATLAAILALAVLPLAGAAFVAVLAVAVVALLVTVWALTRRDHGYGRGGGGYAENRGTQDDDMPPYYASTLFDNTSGSTPFSPDDGQRSCRFDASSDSSIGYSDSGSSGSDCGGSSSDSGGGSSSD
ncbi:hypothetical protein GJ700_16940 [Duganella sp. FT92W]|uniref:Uncharacterized protein n=1 Tax=Pseudoduganella rivuli TaxID=2666085 RepID=A0A7X2IP14_9BURK|nr:hypothetical protein [Pseudoduganella rivuli]MRV73399.1 hypothetical protein [Pseudoduganella rivuli]